MADKITLALENRTVIGTAAGTKKARKAPLTQDSIATAPVIIPPSTKAKKS